MCPLVERKKVLYSIEIIIDMYVYIGAACDKNSFPKATKQEEEEEKR
jgi:hypothetical protein